MHVGRRRVVMDPERACVHAMQCNACVRARAVETEEIQREISMHGWQRHTVTVRAGHGRLQGQFAQSKVRERRASRRTAAAHRLDASACVVLTG
jgi:hypothetical protein